MHVNLDPAQLELEDGNDPLNPLDHARRQGCQQQFCGIERLGVARHVRVECNRGLFAVRLAGLRTQAHRHHVKHQFGCGGIRHASHASILSRWGTPPA